MALTLLRGGPLTGSRTLTAVAAAILLISACSSDSSQTDNTTHAEFIGLPDRDNSSGAFHI